MEYVPLGKTGLQVSELCFGTMTFGNEADEKTSQALFERALETGINFFDSAHNYNKGATEEILGRIMGAHRDRIILTSKVYFPSGGGRNDERLSRRNILRSVEKSLARMKTEYIDIVYLHHWDDTTDIAQAMGALNTLIESGKVHYAGVSNFSAWQTMAANRTARERGYHPLVCCQPMYSLVKRQAEVEILPMAAYEGLAVVPYNALGAGLLTGKYLEGQTGRLTETEMYRQRYDNPQYVETTRRFVAHAHERGVSPAALAVAWVMSHPAIAAPIAGARTVDQFNNTLACLELRLSPEERAAITALSVDPPLATDREPMAAMRTRGW
ncbi:MAG: aldo/keto reductase [Candidatus Hydrogenedentes bacterium]|nr:aldo/keto reductase [Candidatus Hydrogenedentota bacterium]